MSEQRATQPEMFPGQGADRRSFAPVTPLVQMAQTQGYSPDGISTMDTSRQRLHMLGTAYQKRLGSTRQSPGLARSYDALRQHIGTQFDSLQGAGITTRFTNDDFYASPAALGEDMRAGQLKVNATTPDQSSAVFTDAENDKFRAVHDAYGHGVSGRGFSPSDEMAAYEAHARTLPHEARRALFSEVVGQAAYWQTTGEFAPQTNNVVDMPRWAVEGRDPAKHSRTHVSRAKQGKLF